MGRAAGAQQASAQATGLKSRRVGAGRLSHHGGGVPEGEVEPGRLYALPASCLPPPAPRAQGVPRVEGGGRLPEAGAEGSSASRKPSGSSWPLAGQRPSLPPPAPRQLVRGQGAPRGGESKSTRAPAGPKCRGCARGRRGEG